MRSCVELQINEPNTIVIDFYDNLFLQLQKQPQYVMQFNNTDDDILSSTCNRNEHGYIILYLRIIYW
jgi:hypothetical protein